MPALGLLSTVTNHTKNDIPDNKVPKLRINFYLCIIQNKKWSEYFRKVH